MTCAVVVQARMASTRLPGKSLLPFGEASLLERILRRLQRIESPVTLLVASSSGPEDDPIERVCVELGVPCYRGAAEDVLARFAGALETLAPQPELVLRICADRPFLSAALADELLALHDELGRPDYLSNTLEKSYPNGFDLELVRTDALLAAAAEATDPYEREHVTPFLYRRPERFRLANVTCPYGNFSHVRVTVDHPADYEALARVADRLGSGEDWRAVLTLAELEPELFP